jgi:hypothetical protein
MNVYYKGQQAGKLITQIEQMPQGTWKERIDHFQSQPNVRTATLTLGAVVHIRMKDGSTILADYDSALDNDKQDLARQGYQTNMVF